MSDIPVAPIGASPPTDTDFPLDYRALLTCDGTEEWLAASTDELERWLATKKWPLDLASGIDETDGPRHFQLLRHEGQGGRSLRARLVEAETPKGVWTSEITAFQGHTQDSWVRIHVHNDRGHFVDVPRVARALIDRLQLRDGRALLHATPQVYRADRLDELLETLTDADRNGLVFVAGTDAELDFDSFARKLARWTRQVFGLAQVILLDPVATTEFTRHWGGHASAPWTVRTYFPGVDPDSIVDARRHRFLGTARLAGADKSVEVLLGRVARRHASRRHAPPGVVRVRRAFDRIESRLVMAGSTTHEVPTAVASPVIAAPPDASETVETWLQEILHIEDPSREAVLALADRLAKADSERAVTSTLQARLARAEGLVDVLQSRAEGAEDMVRELEDANEDAQLETASAYQQLEDVLGRNRWIESKLRELSAYDVIHGETPVEFLTSYPESFDDLLGRLGELKAGGIIFTGDAEVTSRLADVDTLDQALRRSWDALLCLRDYVRVRKTDPSVSSVGGYIKRTPAGYLGFPPARHAETETGTTMRRWGKERSFPVPDSVDPTGEAVMKAHFKLASIGTVDPRLYYLDKWPADGMVYIGYIGAHLTNTQTSRL